MFDVGGGGGEDVVDDEEKAVDDVGRTERRMSAAVDANVHSQKGGESSSPITCSCHGD